MWDLIKYLSYNFELIIFSLSEKGFVKIELMWNWSGCQLTLLFSWHCSSADLSWKVDLNSVLIVVFFVFLSNSVPNFYQLFSFWRAQFAYFFQFQFSIPSKFDQQTWCWKQIPQFTGKKISVDLFTFLVHSRSHIECFNIEQNPFQIKSQQMRSNYTARNEMVAVELYKKSVIINTDKSRFVILH